MSKLRVVATPLDCGAVWCLSCPHLRWRWRRGRYVNWCRAFRGVGLVREGEWGAKRCSACLEAEVRDV